MTKAVYEFKKMLINDGYTIDEIGVATLNGQQVDVYRAIKDGNGIRRCEVLFWADVDAYHEKPYEDYISVSVDPTGYGRFVRRYNWYHQTAEDHFKALHSYLQGKGLRVG